jgi:hypothetical protein
MNFSGQGTRKAVSLGGRSRKQETADDLLQKSRLEREGRKRARLEDASSKTIQVRVDLAGRWSGGSCMAPRGCLGGEVSTLLAIFV